MKKFGWNGSAFQVLSYKRSLNCSRLPVLITMALKEFLVFCVCQSLFVHSSVIQTVILKLTAGFLLTLHNCAG